MANLFRHPLATPEWESEPAAAVRLATRSLWTAPLRDETTAPARRIVHQRAIFTSTPATFRGLHLGWGPGYHKCASGQERDAALDVVVSRGERDGWSEVARIRTSAGELDDGGARLDLGGLVGTSLVAEVRRAATDGWWPGWNLASAGLELSGDLDRSWTPGPDGWLDVGEVDPTGASPGVVATVGATDVVFRSDHLAVGFRLKSPAWSHLSVDQNGDGRVETNLLQLPRSMDIVRSGVYPSGVYPVLRDQNAEYLTQGPRFAGTDGALPMGFLHRGYRGRTEVRGSTVRYDLEIPGAHQRYVLEFTVHADRIELAAERHGAVDRRAWQSSAWHIALDNRITPSCALGDPTFTGETGLLAGPVTWHHPRYGTFELSGGDGVLWRSDSVRPLDTNTLELKLGEQPTGFGDYLLPAGVHRAEVTLRVATPTLARLAPETPDAVRRALERHTLTALPFRADTATYSNNGASMHCTTSLADVSSIARELDQREGLRPLAWVGDSLQRWLDGAPSYGSGATSHGAHRLEDEYVHMAGNTLLAMGRYLAASEDDAWFDRNRERVLRELDEMLARDVDGDGLVESTIRRGVAGEHQWSTAWADVISFGWKDAWANAVLCVVWTEWEPLLRRHGEHERADRIAHARDALISAYLPTFFNPATGLIGGWRSADGALHDHGFSLVVAQACASDAVPVDRAREIMTALRDAWDATGLDDLRNGIPLNLTRIPEDDIGGVVFGLPMGSYQQGGYSHHGARVLVEAFDRCGMHHDAERVLVELCATIADDSSFGGVGSGRDWRMADGTPSGYEGQLVEGFSVLAAALARYGRP
ncbi:hypothetical protein [Homoserinibacter sp. GY 40078]|uniref:hypothetical protein n=1 Tax=Homoserinibacter sp. GY 40078 TaxID=2603275 RepID=UPI0011C7D52D|nr:hypothetical protein [Homoserinibacter sp. GY 40078]TXK18623.1 hypothetical protein FVQ89_01345 [Homoserinibacter sp. GY 40078]